MKIRTIIPAKTSVVVVNGEKFLLQIRAMVIADIAKIAYTGMSQVLIAARAPTENPRGNIPRNASNPVVFLFALNTKFKDRPIVKIAKGIEIRWA